MRTSERVQWSPSLVRQEPRMCWLQPGGRWRPRWLELQKDGGGQVLLPWRALRRKGMSIDLGWGSGQGGQEVIPVGWSEWQQVARVLRPAVRQAESPAHSPSQLPGPRGLHCPLLYALLLCQPPSPLFLPRSTPGTRASAWVPLAFCLGHSELCLPDPVPHLPLCQAAALPEEPPKFCGIDLCLLMAGTLQQYHPTELYVTMEM